MDPSTDDVKTLKVSELKAQLTSRGLPTNGIKSALQKRLIEALSGDGEEAKASEPAEGGIPVEVEVVEDEIDETTRYTGTVLKFLKRRGFGRIIPAGKTEEDKDDLVFVHWKQIQSDDAWPSLNDGQKVEYYLGKKGNPKDPKKAVFAAKVTLEGGVSVSHADTRDFPNRTTRFVGVVEFFDRRKGFGFIKPKEDFNFEDTDFLASKKGTIYVCREDINTADDVETSPSLKDEAEVEFALYKTTNEDGSIRWAAGDVTNVGGAALTADDFKVRQEGQKRKRTNKNKGKRGKKGQKGKKNQKFPKNKAFQFKGQTLIPMNMAQNQPQVFMMNGQPYMVMPQQFGGMNMGMMNMMGGQAGRPKKRRRKNKKNKNKGGNW
jgi:cold shock CspA family protein